MLANPVITSVLDIWSRRPIKRSQSEWLSANAVCCHHRGESVDTRGRGGIRSSGDQSIAYHCFNCGFKTSYQSGRPLSYRFRRLLGWMGADVNEINRLVIEALRWQTLVGVAPEPEQDQEPIVFDERQLPEGSQSLTYWASTNECPELLAEAINYLDARACALERYQFYWSPNEKQKLSRRITIPFFWKGKVVGSTSRTFVDGITPKYLSDHPANFVFNLDEQTSKRKFVIVAEGPFDAMSIDGVATLTNDISEQQADLIEALNREIIVVPDWDRAGSKMIDRAVELGWSVAFPVWREQCKDLNDAVVKYGKLFVLKSILDSRESNRLKIKLMRK